jgi:hypothetical protein
MVARTRPEPPAIVLEFCRDGDPPERHVVIGSGERILLHAVGLLIRRRELKLHDRLTVTEPADSDFDIPA